MDGPRVRASDVALGIIERVAFADAPMSQTEIAAAAGLVKSAAHKHLRTLEEHGWVARDPETQRYALGPKAWLVGQRATGVGDLAAAAAAGMRRLRDETGLAVVLSSVDGRGLSVIAALAGTHAIEIGVRQGSRIALHASAQGQLLLAEDAALLKATCDGELEALTPRTLVTPARLRKRVERVRADGHAVAAEEVMTGITALAAPVRDYTGRLIATLALVGSVQHLGSPPAPEHVRTVRSLADALSRDRGYRGEPSEAD